MVPILSNWAQAMRDRAIETNFVPAPRGHRLHRADNVKGVTRRATLKLLGSKALAVRVHSLNVKRGEWKARCGRWEPVCPTEGLAMKRLTTVE